MSQPEMQPGGHAREEGPPPFDPAPLGPPSSGPAPFDPPAPAPPSSGPPSSGPPSSGPPSSGPVDGEGPARGDDCPPSGDLTGGPFPPGDWGEPAERLTELYLWVEAGALRTVGWYLAGRVRKRRLARVLRAGAALGVITGTALPLLELTRAVEGAAAWGYLSLLLGAACPACDRYFGLTSGWMRAVGTAQQVQRRLQRLQFDWESECVREVLGPAEGTAGEAADRCLGVLRKFSEDVTELVRTETADWMVEFRAGTAPSVTRSATVGGSRPDCGFPATGRFPLLPGNRPNMPRQRPPEPR